MEKSSGSETMSRYTASNDPEIERKVNKIVETIKDEIIRSVHPKSIILKGSFGRGEASVVEDDGKLKFLSDCEVIVIPKKRIKRGELSRLSRELTQRTGLKVEIAGIELELKFCLPLHLWNRIPPTIDNYELKRGSKVIYGENFLERLPNFKAEDIPVWEGIRLMLNRMIESSQYFSIDYLNKYPSKEAEQNLFFWTNKMLLACQDALLILAKRYHYSYKVRNEIFQEIFLKNFEDLYEQIPNFLPLTVKATEYKLNPKKMYYEDVVEFWFEVAEITDKVFRYVIEKNMGITFDSYVEFQEKYLKHPHIRKKYYRGLSPSVIYQNLRSFVKILVLTHRIPPIKLMLKPRIPWTHLVYSMIPIVYFSKSPNSEVNKSVLEMARRVLFISKNEEDIEKELFNMWYAICY